MERLTKLRSNYPRFYYKNFSWQLEENSLELKWHFHIEPDLDFYPTMQVQGISENQISSLDRAELDSYVFHIGMTELFSYWKLTASPEIVIEAAALSEDQLAWWHSLLIEGMGEYFFVNKIDFTTPEFVVFRAADSARAITASQTDSKTTSSKSKNDKVLIPLGGGKDSVVTLELFRKNLPAEQLGCLLIDPTQAAEDIAEKSGLRTHIISRHLDKKMLELNDQDYLNGHVPISALFAFTSLLSARLNNYSHIAISNERSSNEGNANYLGRDINHQYSKTFQFEKAFNQYVKGNYPANSPQYFSFVRPLYELQIAKIFAEMNAYHPIFRSCNVGQKTNSWCCKCSKCLFAFIILYPFMNPSDLTEFFGENLLENTELLPIALELVGLGEQKPFECVGTHEEAIAAFYFCWQSKSESTPELLQQVYEEVLSKEKNLGSRAEKIMSSWNEHHLIPNDAWENWLREALQ